MLNMTSKLGDGVTNYIFHSDNTIKNSTAILTIFLLAGGAD